MLDQSVFAGFPVTAFPSVISIPTFGLADELRSAFSSLPSCEDIMTVSDVMSPDVVTVAPALPVAEARSLMRQHQIHHLVVQRGSQTVGIVSARDLSRPGGSRKPPQTVADVMTRHVLTAEARTSIDRAAYKMRGHSIGCLIVLNRGRVAGIVTPSDLLGLLSSRARHSRRADTRTAIHHRVVHRHRARADGVW
jgi:CBS domain-containing protein